MPLDVACPSCQTRYSLPEKFQGKKLKCKSCGKPFSATVGVAKAAGSRNAGAAQRAEPDTRVLEQMGLGAIRKQPELFPAEPARGPDPLRNHVVQDPGFGSAEGAVQIAGTASGLAADAAARDAMTIDDDEAAVIANPFVRAKPEKAGSKKKQTGDADDTAGGNRKRNGKSKVHPGVKESLDKATMTMLVIGVLIAMFFGFFMISAYSDELANLKNINNFDQLGMTNAEMEAEAAELAAPRRVFCGIGIGIGVIFGILAFGVQIFPITCSILSLVFYLGFELVWTLLTFDFLSISGWIRRVFVCGALGKAFMDSLNARSYAQMMAERGR